MNDSRWAILFILAGIVLFVAMPQWRAIGKAAESYPMTLESFDAKAREMVAAHGTGREEDGVPVVRPPEGDVYLVARRWSFWPVLELQAGRSYRLHATSADILHGLAIQGQDVLLAPGLASVLEIQPRRTGRLVLQCSEFCGAEHNKMRQDVEVVTAR